MGASQSKSDIDEKVFYNNDVPIQARSFSGKRKMLAMHH